MFQAEGTVCANLIMGAESVYDSDQRPLWLKYVGGDRGRGSVVGDKVGEKSVTQSKLSLLAARRPVNRRRGVETRNMTLFGKPAGREDGRLKSQNNHLIGVWMPVSFIAQRGGGDEEVE